MRLDARSRIAWSLAALCLVSAQTIPPLAATSPDPGQAATDQQTQTPSYLPGSLSAATFVGTAEQATFLTSYDNMGNGGAGNGAGGTGTAAGGSGAGGANGASSTVFETTTFTPGASTVTASAGAGGSAGSSGGSGQQQYISRSAAPSLDTDRTAGGLLFGFLVATALVL